MKIAVSTASFLLTLLALEVGLRLYGYYPLKDWLSGGGSLFRASASPELKYELIPGASRFAERVTKINSEGFRGPEPSSGSSEKRVIVLGDSIAFGNFLNWEDTFSNQLQQRLHSDNRAVEVLDLGVGGYDVLQEVATLEIRGLKYHPDLVVVAYCLNDISIDSVNLDDIERMRSRQRSFFYRSRLVQLLSTSVDKIRFKRWTSHMNQPEVFHREYEHQIDPIGEDESELLGLMNKAPRWPSMTWYGDRDRVGRLRFAFRHLADISKQNGFSVVIMTVPLLIGDAESYTHRAAHRIVEMEARRVGFDTLELTDSFMRAGMENLKADWGDIIHPNARGNGIMAELLSEYVVKHLGDQPPADKSNGRQK